MFADQKSSGFVKSHLILKCREFDRESCSWQGVLNTSLNN